MNEEIRRPYERAHTSRVVNQPQQAPAVARSANFDDFHDDDLLCDVDVDQIASIAVAGPLNGSTANDRRRIESDILFDDDLDDDDFLQIGSQLDEQQHSEQPSNVNVDHDDGSFEIGASVTEPQHNVAVTDDAYRFKIRGINLATVKQLNACPPQDKVRRKHLLIKGEIDSIHGNKIVREYGYSYANVLDSLDCCIIP